MSRLYIERGLSRRKKDTLFIVRAGMVLSAVIALIVITAVLALIFYVFILPHPRIAMASEIHKGNQIVSKAEFCK